MTLPRLTWPIADLSVAHLNPHLNPTAAVFMAREMGALTHPGTPIEQTRCMGSAAERLAYAAFSTPPQEHMRWLGAWCGGALFGVVLVKVSWPSAQMANLLVAEQARGHGIGRRLFEVAVQEARGVGCSSVTLTAQHAATQRLAEHYGAIRGGVDPSGPYYVLHLGQDCFPSLPGYIGEGCGGNCDGRVDNPATPG
jgi:GNAT superfamily N-acetyltransferase